MLHLTVDNIKDNLSLFLSGAEDPSSAINPPELQPLNDRFNAHRDGLQSAVLLGELKEQGTFLGDAGCIDMGTGRAIRDGDSIRDLLQFEDAGSVNGLLPHSFYLQQESTLFRLKDKFDELYPKNGRIYAEEHYFWENGIQIYWEKLESPSRREEIVMWRDSERVISRTAYHPSILDTFNDPAFALANDIVRQYDLYDDTLSLVPPWHTRAELRPGSLVAVDVVIVVFDELVRGGATGKIWHRYYKAFAKAVFVIKRGSNKCLPNRTPMHDFLVMPAVEHSVGVQNQVDKAMKRKADKISSKISTHPLRQAKRKIFIEDVEI